MAAGRIRLNKGEIEVIKYGCEWDTRKGGRCVSRCFGGFIALCPVTGLSGHFKTTECVVKTCERFS
jgi:hypothetical protein